MPDPIDPRLAWVITAATLAIIVALIIWAALAAAGVVQS